MKIDTGSTAALIAQRSMSSIQAAAKPLQSPTTASTASTGSGGIQQLDFTNMTRQEMRDWANNQVKSGQMSLDDAAPLFAMTMKIPVAGSGDLSAADSSERVDFAKAISEGMQGARSRNDNVTLQMLQSALATVQRYQGQARSVDVHV